MHESLRVGRGFCGTKGPFNIHTYPSSQGLFLYVYPMFVINWKSYNIDLLNFHNVCTVEHLYKKIPEIRTPFNQDSVSDPSYIYRAKLHKTTLM